MKSSKISQNETGLLHYTPLRYPGGKGKLAAYVKKIIEKNGMMDGEYVEPFAGGAAIALELLFHEYVSTIHINDISKPVHAFWRTVLDHTEELCRLVSDTPVTIDSWDKHKCVLQAPDQHCITDLGFAMFFLNRTNRSGILNAGVIGGRSQSGNWKINARYNSKDLINRIQSIAKMRGRIRVTGLDAVDFLSHGTRKWPNNTLIYSDPPYYVKGRDLYYNFYKHDDHVSISHAIQSGIKNQRWIVSYDDVPSIRELYSERQWISYDIGYSARTTRKGTEIMFFDDSLCIPDLAGPISLVTDYRHPIIC